MRGEPRPSAAGVRAPQAPWEGAHRTSESGFPALSPGTVGGSQRGCTCVPEALTAMGSRVGAWVLGFGGPLPSTKLQPRFAAPSAPSARGASAFLEAPPPPGRGVKQLCLVVCVSWQHMSPVFL